jgi:hypothetical protein
MSERKQSHERARKLADYERLARENAMLKAELQHGRQTIAELSEQLEFDRSLVADCLTNAKNAVKSRLWLTEGRGSYEWNDDRWREEFGAAANEFLKAIEPMEKVSRDWTGCPKTGEEIAKARIDLKAELERLTDLTQRDRIVLAEALINPPEPNDKLKDAAERLEIK